MAGPLFVLFNLSIVIVWLIERTNRRRLETLEKETGADLVPERRLTFSLARVCFAPVGDAKI